MATQRAPKAQAIRCAIYTRKSSEEGLEQEFNSLDAQRESAEAYISSMKHEGWVCLPERYDDGGFTGGNMERPGVQRLFKDIEAGLIDCVIVYKVDRLSRSLMDFARMMQVFEKHRVSFVSVTQQFNTSNSMGRLTLHILLSFAQFERELVSERTRDKIAGARKRGLWAGGRPVLGYDLSKCRLTVNEEEAVRVREIFAIYLRTGSMNRTVEEMTARGWGTKRWTTKAGRVMGGERVSKGYLHTLLNNVVYLGRVRHNENVYAGEHPAIIDEEVWNLVQARIRENTQNGPSHIRNRYGAILKGILRCGPCDTPMVHNFTTKDTGVCYRYYTCFTAQTRGYHACGSRSLPAEQIEQFVIDRIKAMGQDKALVTLVLDQARRQDREQVAQHEAELLTLEREMRWLASETRRAGAESAHAAEAGERLADLADWTRLTEDRMTERRAAAAEITQRMVTRDQAEKEVVAFEPLWESLSIRERARLLRLVVKRVTFDGDKGEIAITFHPEAEWLAREAA